MKHPKTCDRCRALEGRQGESSRCLLGFAVYRTCVIMGVSVDSPYPPLTGCPKPLTIAALIHSPLKSELK